MWPPVTVKQRLAARVVRISAASYTIPMAPMLNVECLEREPQWQAKEKQLKWPGLPSSAHLENKLRDSSNVQDFA